MMNNCDFFMALNFLAKAIVITRESVAPQAHASLLNHYYQTKMAASAYL